MGALDRVKILLVDDSPENLLSANELAGLLAYQYRDTRHFPAFYGGMVVPRDAPFDFLRSGTPDWLDRVALKTGTMDTPHSVCGLAGYLRKKDGGWMASYGSQRPVTSSAERFDAATRDAGSRASGSRRPVTTNRPPSRPCETTTSPGSARSCVR